MRSRRMSKWIHIPKRAVAKNALGSEWVNESRIWSSTQSTHDNTRYWNRAIGDYANESKSKEQYSATPTDPYSIYVESGLYYVRREPDKWVVAIPMYNDCDSELTRRVRYRYDRVRIRHERRRQAWPEILTTWAFTNQMRNQYAYSARPKTWGSTVWAVTIRTHVNGSHQWILVARYAGSLKWVMRYT